MSNAKTAEIIKILEKHSFTIPTGKGENYCCNILDAAEEIVAQFQQPAPQEKGVSDDLGSMMVDWNDKPLESYVNHLKEKFKVDSSGTAKSVYEVISALEKQHHRIAELEKRVNKVTDSWYNEKQKVLELTDSITVLEIKIEILQERIAELEREKEEMKQWLFHTEDCGDKRRYNNSHCSCGLNDFAAKQIQSERGNGE